MTGLPHLIGAWWAGAKAEVLSDNSGEVQMTKESLTNFLARNLPARHAQFADYYVAATNAHAPLPGLPSHDFALILAGLIDRESFYKSGEWALRPPGPEGTGDFLPRWYAPDRLPEALIDMVDAWGLYTGNQKTNLAGELIFEVKPPAWAGAEFAGWGYGLGQFDFLSHKEWLAANDWKHPAVNLDRAAEIFAANYDQLGDVKSALAAYNAGLAKIKSIKKGTDPDRFTTGRNYAADILARAGGFGLTRAV